MKNFLAERFPVLWNTGLFLVLPLVFLAHISFTTFVLLLYFGPYFGGNVEIRCFLLSA